MTDHKLRLKSGIYEQLKAYLGESTDQGMAERLNISYMTVRKAKAASRDQNLPAPMLFVSAANRVTLWSLDSLVTNKFQTDKKTA